MFACCGQQSNLSLAVKFFLHLWSALLLLTNAIRTFATRVSRYKPRPCTVFEAMLAFAQTYHFPAGPAGGYRCVVSAHVGWHVFADAQGSVCLFCAHHEPSRTNRKRRKDYFSTPDPVWCCGLGKGMFSMRDASRVWVAKGKRFSLSKINYRFDRWSPLAGVLCASVCVGTALLDTSVRFPFSNILPRSFACRSCSTRYFGILVWRWSMVYDA